MSHETERTKVVPERDFSWEMLVSSDGYTLPYRLYIPKNYDCGATYPLMLFLHGSGERGCDNTAQVTVALPHVFDDPTSPAYDSIIVAPQCPEDKQWVYTPWEKGNYSVSEVTESRELEAVLEILRKVASEYNVDRSRVYVTGISMGGFGTWDMLARHSSIFAAGMPVCGGGDPSMAKTLSEIPIRTFHGFLDNSVPTEGTREMYASIKACGKGKIRFTEFEDGDHGIWDRVYSDSKNIKWLFSKEKHIRNNEKKKSAGLRRARNAGIALGIIGGALLLFRKKKK